MNRVGRSVPAAPATTPHASSGWSRRACATIASYTSLLTSSTQRGYGDPATVGTMRLVLLESHSDQSSGIVAGGNAAKIRGWTARVPGTDRPAQAQHRSDGSGTYWDDDAG